VKQALQKPSDKSPIVSHMGQRIREGLFIVSLATALFLFVAFVSFNTSDPGWSSTGTDKVLNWGGKVGAFFADVFLSLFGYMAYILPVMIVFATGISARVKEKTKSPALDVFFKSLGFILIALSNCALVSINFKFTSSYLPASSGGILGDVVANMLLHTFNLTGGVLVLITAFLCGVTLFTGFSWLFFAEIIHAKFKSYLTQVPKFPKFNLFARFKKPPIEISRLESRYKKPSPSRLEPNLNEVQEKPQTIKEKFISSVSQKVAVFKEKPKPQIVEKRITSKLTSSVTLAPGCVPPLDLLDPVPISDGKAFTHTTFEELSNLVEQRLLDFGVEVKVVAVHPGPIITRFELELAPGIKVSKITGLAKDIARSLSATSVRVVEVIPGKSVIGLELPNEHREVVCLRDILESQRYIQAKSPVSLALGKDIAGYPVVVDLAKMPHLLVAGTTGSGKSVSLNAMLLSLLYKATPEQLKLILIDPKMLELSIYEGIPHLLTPVITDMKDAANALRWSVGEMERRYKLMATLGVRNLAGFNQKIVEAEKMGNPLIAPTWLSGEGNPPAPLEQLPMIVVVADELADMMMVVGKKVEDLITRIAQKARAAGIHLILATQRPSVDVITGLIKANIPTRIAFQVSSRIDSRTILDQQGAEQLLGNGDMLYLPPGTGLPVRVHGAFVADEEVHRVVAAWQTYGKPEYLPDVTADASEGLNAEAAMGGELDALYDEALRIVTESRRASISLVQRRLKIGYNRAARIMEDMESAGVVSTMDHTGTREVLAPSPVEI